MMIPLIVYSLCALTSCICAVMLLRAYRRTRVRLLLWSGLCFAFFTINNLILIVDERMTTQDFSLVRTFPLLAGIALLLYGLVWEPE
jgi:hypothetical protein